MLHAETPANAPAEFPLTLADIRVRDPFILPEGGMYYLYAQGGNRALNDNADLGVEVYRSRDLVHWSKPKQVFVRPKKGFWGRPPVAKKFKGIVEKIVAARPPPHVVVAQVTPRSEFTQSIADYNTSIRETLVPEFQQRGCKVSTVDQYRNMLKPDGTIDPGLFSNKINHPNATAYDRMAQTWFEAIQAIFPSVKK